MSHPRHPQRVQYTYVHGKLFEANQGNQTEVQSLSPYQQTKPPARPHISSSHGISSQKSPHLIGQRPEVSSFEVNASQNYEAKNRSILIFVNIGQ